MGVSVCSFCADSEVDSHSESLQVHCFFICYIFCVLWIQAILTFTAKLFWGPGGSLKSWRHYMLDPNILLLRKKLGIVWIPSQLYITVPGLGFVVRVCLSLSYLFPCGYFFVHLICTSHWASFGISFRGNCPMCSSWFSVYKGGSEFRSLLLPSLTRTPKTI